MRSESNKSANRKFSQARQFLCRMIDGGEFGDERYLPPVRALAKAAGVSRSTMWHVVNALQKEGRLHGRYRHRAVLTAEPVGIPDTSTDNEATPRLSFTKSQSLQVRIEREILNGRFRHDQPLPPEKELTELFGVSRMTLRKALRALTERTVLKPCGHGHLPVSVACPASRSRQRIVLFGQGGSMGENLFWEYWHQEYVKLAELECSKAGIDLDIVCFERVEGRLQFKDGRDGKLYSLPRGSELMGCLTEVTNQESMDDELLQLITETKRPLAILDEIGKWPSREQLALHRNLRVFRNTVAAGAARDVGRFLLELGHRTALFISPYHHFEYSIRRCEALQKAFSTADNARIIPLTSHFDIRQYQSEAAQRANLAAMMKFFEQWWEGIEPYDAYRPYLWNHFQLLKTVAYDGRTREDLIGLFDRALKIKEATAWILVNDFCAGPAFDFLARKRIAVPGRYSIVSFDDTPESVLKGITSYNFGNTATMIAMLRYVTNPRLFPASKPVIEIEGHLVQRRTTAGPRRG